MSNEAGSRFSWPIVCGLLFVVYCLWSIVRSLFRLNASPHLERSEVAIHASLLIRVSVSGYALDEDALDVGEFDGMIFQARVAQGERIV